MSRAVPYRSKIPEIVNQRVQETMENRMYLVQVIGPTSYVIKQQHCEIRFKVMIGNIQLCSCGDKEICTHILFVMLKVLRVPSSNPITWQKSLIDSEIEMLLRGDYRERVQDTAKQSAKYLKRRQKEGIESLDTSDIMDVKNEDVSRHEIAEGEVCAICQEDMHEDQPLTFCRKGCGNNFHIECMKVFGESRKQSKETIICPLCRCDWGELALATLKKEIDQSNRAIDVHRNVSCKHCKLKPLRKVRHRCIQCKNVDLCGHCFNNNVHKQHAFVSKKMPTDQWIPGIRKNDAVTEHLSAGVISELQGRELSNNDYETLLQLDQVGEQTLQQYLQAKLPGTLYAANSKVAYVGIQATCTICTQSLRLPTHIHVIPCGHAFHQSCISRSILMENYACPYFNCSQILFPGLHTLLVRKDKKVTDCTHDSVHSSNSNHEKPNTFGNGSSIYPELSIGGTTINRQGHLQSTSHSQASNTFTSDVHGRNILYGTRKYNKPQHNCQTQIKEVVLPFLSLSVQPVHTRVPSRESAYHLQPNQQNHKNDELNSNHDTFNYDEKHLPALNGMSSNKSTISTVNQVATLNQKKHIVSSKLKSEDITNLNIKFDSHNKKLAPMETISIPLSEKLIKAEQNRHSIKLQRKALSELGKHTHISVKQHTSNFSEESDKIFPSLFITNLPKR